MKKLIKGYKAFDKNMTCHGKKFEEGKTYEEKEVKICNKGFHFCENPLDCLNYYNLCDSIFRKVESTGKTARHNEDTKIATTKITIGAKLSLSGFIETSINFLMKVCKVKSGDSSKQASSGDSSKQASSGDSSQQASSGDYSKQASSGYSSKQASSGYYSKQASSGDSSQQASSGYSSKQASSGDSSQHISTGKDSVIAAIGINSQAKGVKGNWITLAEWNYNEKKKRYIPTLVKSIKIDGKKIKENVYYKLKNKKFIEVD